LGLPLDNATKFYSRQPFGTLHSGSVLSHSLNSEYTGRSLAVRALKFACDKLRKRANRYTQFRGAKKGKLL